MASNSDKSFFRLLTVAPRPRELTGAVDLISHYGLREHYDTFCKNPLPASIADSHYLNNVVGDTELRRGEGMELCQLVQGTAGACLPADSVQFEPFDLEYLRQAFTLRETGLISLTEDERGQPTISGKVTGEQDDPEKKKKKKHRHRHKDKDKEREKDKDKEKKKDRDKEKVRDKDKDKDRVKGENGDDRSRKHRKKKRRHDGDEEEGDGHKHKSKKHKHSSKVDGLANVTKNGK